MFKKNSFLIVLLALIIISCQKEETIIPSSVEENTDSISLRALHDLCFTSYNIHALDIPFCPIDEDDALYIAEALVDKDSDVIFLQEVWWEGGADIIIEHLLANGYVDFAFDASSGLLTISKFELLDVQVVEFTLDSGTDQIKDKGFMSAFIELEEGCDFNIINTHLQANGGLIDGVVDIFNGNFIGGPSESAIRKRQMIQIRNFVHSLPNCTPSIIGGDFNIDVDSEEMNELINILPGRPTFILSGDTYVPQTSHGGGTLDYFLLNNFGSYFSNLTNTTIVGDCLESYTIEKFNLIHYYEDSRGKLVWEVVGSYDTREEVQQALNQTNTTDPGAPGSYFIQAETIEVCTREFINPSDHNPIETCFTYDCAHQEDCGEQIFVNPYPNNNTSQECGTHNQCPEGQQCFEGTCQPW